MSRQIAVRIPDDLHAALVRLAEQDGRTKSNLIVLLLKEAVEKRAAKQSAKEGA